MVYWLPVRRLLLWLAVASGLFLMVASCLPLNLTQAYEFQALRERGDPSYGPSQISVAIAPGLVFVWAGLATVLMVITVVLPMQDRRSGAITASDRVFTIAAILLMAGPMALLTWFAIDEGGIYRSTGYLYLPWYLPLVIAGNITWALALSGALFVHQPARDPAVL